VVVSQAAIMTANTASATQRETAEYNGFIDDRPGKITTRRHHRAAPDGWQATRRTRSVSV